MQPRSSPKGSSSLSVATSRSLGAGAVASLRSRGGAPEARRKPRLETSSSAPRVGFAAVDTKPFSCTRSPEEDMLSFARDFARRAQRALERSAPLGEEAEREQAERQVGVDKATEALEACDERLRSIGYRLEARNELLGKLHAEAQASVAKGKSVTLLTEKTLRSKCIPLESRWTSPGWSAPLVEMPEGSQLWDPRDCLHRRTVVDVLDPD